MIVRHHQRRRQHLTLGAAFVTLAEGSCGTARCRHRCAGDFPCAIQRPCHHRADRPGDHALR